MKTIRKILVPTDFSEHSFTALEYVLSLTAMYDAKIYLIHVVDAMPVYAFPQVDLHSETVFRDMVAKAHEELNHLVSRKVGNTRKVVTTVLRGEVYKEIVNFAQEEGIDLIVIATHGRTGLAHVVMGSVAEKVIRYSPVPVLTVKPEKVIENLLKNSDVEEQLHLKIKSKN